MQFHEAKKLVERGLILPAPGAVYVNKDVVLERLAPGAVLYPGAQVSGSATTLAPGSKVGTEGPAQIRNVALGRGASIASGTAENCCLLDGASLGPNSHVRAGTLLEEFASTGHAVGLKQTILLSFVTLGSQINFCDCLMAGGTSRNDHSEVGSGFIHFNFTPFGERGDKATASLFGDVQRGVFLKDGRIFLGGCGGVVGPVQVDYGTTLAAGSVYRKDYGPGLLAYGEKTIAKSRSFDPLLVRGVGRRVDRCLNYVGELRALYAWYEHVRLAAASDDIDALVIRSGMERITEGIKERGKQIERFLGGAKPADDDAQADIVASQGKWSALKAGFVVSPETASHESLRLSFLDANSPGEDHVAWVQSLSAAEIEKGRAWLTAVAQPSSPS
ncbi:MAG: hypothetical protein ACI97A_000179 [Planctomycetota bacterium]|jgi:hypothetical protein